MSGKKSGSNKVKSSKNSAASKKRNNNPVSETFQKSGKAAKLDKKNKNIQIQKAEDITSTRDIIDDDNRYNEEMNAINSSRKEKLLVGGVIVAISLILIIVLARSYIVPKDDASELSGAVVGDSDAYDLDGSVQDDSGDENIEGSSGKIVDVHESNINSPDEIDSSKVDPKTSMDESDEETGNPADTENLEEEELLGPLDEDIAGYSLRPACSKGYHLAEVYYEFSDLPSYVTIQVRNDSEHGSEFEDLVEERGELKKYTYFYVCNECPVGDEVQILAGNDYSVRLKIDRFNDISYSEVLGFSTKDDSPYMTKICSSKDIKTGCEDTESSPNPKIRSKVTYQGEEYYENCVNNTHTEEFWCEGDEIRKDVASCDRFCWLGRCM
ncbi:MAG: hypothetical protein ACLFUO_03190 [Candidatus Woesearchaeota archaeon]